MNAVLGIHVATFVLVRSAGFYWGKWLGRRPPPGVVAHEVGGRGHAHYERPYLWKVLGMPCKALPIFDMMHDPR